MACNKKIKGRRSESEKRNKQTRKNKSMRNSRFTRLLDRRNQTFPTDRTTWTRTVNTGGIKWVYNMADVFYDISTTLGYMTHASPRLACTAIWGILRSIRFFSFLPVKATGRVWSAAFRPSASPMLARPVLADHKKGPTPGIPHSRSREQKGNPGRRKTTRGSSRRPWALEKINRFYAAHGWPPFLISLGIKW